MRTVKECLQMADRDDILGSLAYDFLCDPIALLEVQDHTVRDIQEKYKAHMSRFIDTLLEIDPKPSDGKVVFLADSMLNGRKDREVLMCDVHEVLASADARYYDCGFTEWKTILGYLVADNKLTQDHIAELLAMLLSEMSWMGTEESAWKERLVEIENKLDESKRKNPSRRRENRYRLWRRISRAWRETGVPTAGGHEGVLCGRK